MIDPGLAIAIIFGVLVALWGALAWVIRRAPVGYQDEHGFHHGRPDRSELFVPEEWLR